MLESEDYKPKKSDREKPINKKLNGWDIMFFKHILEINSTALKDLGPKIERYIFAARYLMFDTFLCKLNCFVANIPNIYVSRNDFIKLFSIQEEPDEEGEEEENQQENNDELEEKVDE